MKVLQKKKSPKHKIGPQLGIFPCINNKEQQELVPTDQEIQVCLQALKQTKTRQEIHQILTVLYRMFILDQQCQRQLQSIIQERKSNLGKRQEESKPKEPSITLKHLQWSKNIPQGEQQPFLQRQITAKVLCSHDSGFSAWKSQIQHSKLKINPLLSRYRRLSESIAVAIFRKVQNLYDQHCQKIDKRSSREEIRSKFACITDSHKKFSQRQRNTLASIIKATYGLESGTISIRELKKLYNTLLDGTKTQEQLNDDEKELQTQSSPAQEQTLGLQHIWNWQMQIQLLKFYIQNQSFANMRSYFQKNKPKDASLFTTEFLRGQLRKSVRAALRKLKHNLRQYEIEHQLTKIRDKQMQYIFRSGRFLDVRLRLIAMYLKPGCEKKEVTDISDAILREIEYQLAQVEVHKEKRHDRTHGDSLFSYKTRQDKDEEAINDYKQQELSQ